MTTETTIRIVALCIALASTETLHGIARTIFLAPRLGKALAIKVSIVSGSLLALGVCYLLVPGIGLKEAKSLWGLGLLIALFMAGFDIAMGRLLLRRSWRKAFDDFDPRTGNYLLFGLLLLVSYPTLVMYLKGG